MSAIRFSFALLAIAALGAGPPAKPHVDPEGNPLPAGAIARVGSARFRAGTNLAWLAYAPDGKTVAAFGGDELTLWEADSGQLRWHVKFASAYNPAIAFHADSNAITLFSDGVLRTMDVQTGKELLPSRIATADHRCARFNADRSAVAFRNANGLIRVITLPAGKEKFATKPHGKWVQVLAFSPDGRVLAAGMTSGGIELFDGRTGAALFELETPFKDIAHVNFSPDSQKLLGTSHTAGPTMIWDLATRKVLSRVAVRAGPPFFVHVCSAFAPDGKTVAVGGGPRVSLCDVGTGKEVRVLEGLYGCVRLAFSADGKTLLAGALDGEISQWDVATARRLPASATPPGGLGVVRFTGNDKHLVTSETDTFVIRDWQTGQDVRRYPRVPSAGNRFTALSPDGTALATADDTGVALRDAATGKITQQLDTAVKYMRYPHFSVDGRKLFVVGGENGMYLWDTIGGKALQEMKGNKGWINTAVRSADGRWLVTEGYDRVASKHELILWEAATGRLVRRLVPPDGYIARFALSAVGRDWAIAEEDATSRGRRAEVSISDALSGAGRRTFVTERGIDTLTFSRDGRTLVVGVGGALSLWEIATGQRRHRFEGHKSSASSLAFSADGSLLAAASADAPVFVWDVYDKHAAPPAWPAAPERLWQDLSDTNAQTGFRAVRCLIGNPVPAVALIRARLKPLPAAEPHRVAQWLRELDSDDFTVRQSAYAELEKLGERIEAPLRTALAGALPLEAKRRVEALVAKLRLPTAERLTRIRALEALEQMGTIEARRLLKTLAMGGRAN